MPDTVPDAAPEPAPPRRVARVPPVAAALAAAWGVGSVARVALVNADGPLGGATPWAVVLVLVLTVAGGAGAILATRALTRRGVVLGVAAAVAVLAVARTLAPVVVQLDHSFVARTDRTATCRGWELRYYPPDTSDAPSSTYCVGIEGPVP